MSNCNSGSNRLSPSAAQMTNAWLVKREHTNLVSAARHSPWLNAGAVNSTYGVIKALTGIAMTDAERQTAVSMLNWAARS